MVQSNNGNQQQPPFHPIWGPLHPDPFSIMPPNSFKQSANNQAQTNMPPFVQGFFDKDGNWDFDKMMSGADKVAKIINQTQPMIKQLGPLFNLFKK